jgi:hypothetical protein
MFHFPALPHAALCIQAAATAHDGRRVSPFGNPRITAWLPAPRGISQAPASFIGSWCQGIHRVPCKTWHIHALHTTTQRPPRSAGGSRIDARVHCAVLKKRDRASPPPPPDRGGPGSRPRRENPPPAGRRFPQDPTACPAAGPRPPPFPAPRNAGDAYQTGSSRHGSRIASAPPEDTGAAPGTSAPRGASALLRKEVIQPHLPVRLPCYDFVPIADPTFDSSLPMRG